MSSSQPAVPGAKRKRPPTFQHLPDHKAKSLKKAWVEKTKIKSQWKAQKRKEDLTSRTQLEIPVYENESPHDRFAGSNDDEEAESSSMASGKAPYVHPSRSHIHPDELVGQANLPPLSKQPLKNDKGGDSRPLKKRKRSPEVESAEEKSDAVQSLRELKREAYSASTLHNFKADPLKKNRHQASGTRGRGRGAASRGRVGTSRGQPNMKLRMNAMLAEIKQSLA